MSQRFSDISRPHGPAPMWPAFLRVALVATLLLLGLIFYAVPLP